MLHTPVASMDLPNDNSRVKLLQATRSMLESVHKLVASSYELALLPNHCVAYWVSVVLRQQSN